MEDFIESEGGRNKKLVMSDTNLRNLHCDNFGMFRSANHLWSEERFLISSKRP